MKAKATQRHRPNTLPTAAAIGLLLLASSCVQFKTASLYDGVMERPKPPKPDKIDRVVEPVIFVDSDRDVWGMETNECQVASISNDIAYEGPASIKVKWDRGAEGCTWAGFGIGWEGWAGKDLSAIMDHAAISFYVRTIEGKAFGLPFVLTLEDYSGGLGFCYTANKYFERTTIDEEWQQVIVPLGDFDIETENLDVTNIKQLQIELQQSGGVYVDNMKLMFYEAPPLEPWLEEEDLPDPLDFPITVFEDEFINGHGWGMIKDDCQDFSVVDKEDGTGKMIRAVYDKTSEECTLVEFGVSWNKWHPTDITPAMEYGAVVFDIKVPTGPGADDLNLRVGFEDYDRALTFVKLQSSQISTGDYLIGWATVRIPFSSFPEDDADLKRVKHMFFGPEGKGEFLIDNIRLERLEDN